MRVRGEPDAMNENGEFPPIFKTLALSVSFPSLATSLSSRFRARESFKHVSEGAV